MWRLQPLKESRSTQWEKQFCLIEVVALGLSSFHLFPLVGLSFTVKNVSRGILSILFIILKV